LTVKRLLAIPTLGLTAVLGIAACSSSTTSASAPQSVHSTVSAAPQSSKAVPVAPAVVTSTSTPEQTAAQLESVVSAKIPDGSWQTSGGNFYGAYAQADFFGTGDGSSSIREELFHSDALAKAGLEQQIAAEGDQYYSEYQNGSVDTFVFNSATTAEINAAHAACNSLPLG
jgi:hypothetical protein